MPRSTVPKVVCNSSLPIRGRLSTATKTCIGTVTGNGLGGLAPM